MARRRRTLDAVAAVGVHVSAGREVTSSFAPNASASSPAVTHTIPSAATTNHDQISRSQARHERRLVGWDFRRGVLVGTDVWSAPVTSSTPANRAAPGSLAHPTDATQAQNQERWTRHSRDRLVAGPASYGEGLAVSHLRGSDAAAAVEVRPAPVADFDRDRSGRGISSWIPRPPGEGDPAVRSGSAMPSFPLAAVARRWILRSLWGRRCSS